MTRTSSKSQASATAMRSAGVFMVSGAPVTAQAPKVPPAGQKAPAAAQGVAPAAPSVQKGLADRNATAFTIKFAGVFPKYGSTLTAAGMLNGRPVFKTAQGEFFQVDPQIGDLKFHTAESLGYLKMDDWERKASAKAGTFIKLRSEQRVSVLGVDGMGNVIQQNSRGEKFYLAPSGDMVFVK